MVFIKYTNKNKTKNNNNYMHIHSSWNSDRVAACCISKPHKTAVVRRPVRMYTEFRGPALTVKTYRGAVKFAHVYEADVIGARLSADELEVELENGATYLYAFEAGRFHLQTLPTPAATPRSAENVICAA